MQLKNCISFGHGTFAQSVSKHERKVASEHNFFEEGDESIGDNLLEYLQG